MVHATVPHSPWILTPEGHQYLPRSFETLAIDGLQNATAGRTTRS